VVAEEQKAVADGKNDIDSQSNLEST